MSLAPHLLQQAAAGGLEGTFAHVVPVAVVDGLETVEVEITHRCLSPGSTLAGGSAAKSSPLRSYMPWLQCQRNGLAGVHESDCPLRSVSWRVNNSLSASKPTAVPDGTVPPNSRNRRT